MGQESYALLKVRWKTIPKCVRTQLRPKEHGQPFLVGNVVLPACLVWVPINHHDLETDEPELLVSQLVGYLPRSLVESNREPRGVLLFADGGEPQKRWPHKSSWKNFTALEEPTFGRWVKITSQDFNLPEIPPSRTKAALDALIESLDETTLTALLIAQGRGDLTLATRILERARGAPIVQSIAVELSTWMQQNKNEE